LIYIRVRAGLPWHLAPMTRASLRILLSLILVAALGLLGQVRAPAALAMGLAQGATVLVICGVTGPETVLLDARGQPVADPHPDCPVCPDCLTPAVSLPGQAAWVHPGAPVRPAAALILTSPNVARPAVAAPLARAPPLKA
jgi:hypothetical protein